jgi:hypothetical protein
MQQPTKYSIGTIMRIEIALLEPVAKENFSREDVGILNIM